MGGELKFKDVGEDIFYLTIFDFLEQLDSLEKVTFTVGTSGKNYIDLLATSYNHYAFKLNAQSLLPLFHKALKKIISNPESLQKFQELGATPVDIALIKGDFAEISQMAASNTYADSYKIVQEWRLLPVVAAEVISAGEEAIILAKSVRFKIGDESVPLHSLHQHAFKHQKSDLPAKSMLIDIQGTGGKSWDYHEAEVWHHALMPSFDKTVHLGNGSWPIRAKDMLKLRKPTGNLRNVAIIAQGCV